MKEYKRQTRECSFNDFPPEIIAAIRKYVEKNELENVEAEALMCAETTSEKIKQGFFASVFGGGNFAVKTCVVVTPKRILWATLDNKNATAVLAARLTEIEVKDFSSALVEDKGLDVFGLIGGFSERVTAFIGLGEGAAADKLRGVLDEAIENAGK